MKSYPGVWAFLLLSLPLAPRTASATTRPSAADAALQLHGPAATVPDDSDSKDHAKDCLILLDAGSPVVLTDYEVSTDPGGKPEIHFAVDEAHAEQVKRLTEKHLGGRLALVVNGDVIDAPRVRAVTTTQGFTVNFTDRTRFETVKAALAAAGGAVPASSDAQL